MKPNRFCIIVITILQIAGIHFVAAGGGGDKTPAFSDKVRRHTNGKTFPVGQDRLNAIARDFTAWLHTNRILQRHPELWTNNNRTDTQVMAFDQLKSTSPDLEIRWHESNGTPIYISGSRLATPATTLRLQTPMTRNLSTAWAFLSGNAGLLRISEPMSELRQVDYETDELGRTHVRFTQTWRGLEIWGKEIRVHLDPSGVVDGFNGRYIPSPSDMQNTASTIPESEAIALALNDLSEKKEIRTLSPFEKKLLEYDGPTAVKMIFCDYGDESPHIAYKIETRSDFVNFWHYFVDAQNGKILAKYNATCFDGPAKAQATDLNGVTRTIDTYQFQGPYYLIDASRQMYNATTSVFPDKTVGTIWTLSANNTDLQNVTQINSTNNTWSDPSAVSAHANGALTYEYFLQTHGRNSIDGNGGTVISVVHVGQSLDNASWNGKVMSYGDGATSFKPLAGGLDVAAHEMAHGVTERSANLEYVFQSGALNESFSDMFGIMVDRDDYKVGELIVQPGVFPGGCLRDMQDPHNGGTDLSTRGWQPNHMNEFVQLTIDQDNGGVHINSGIPNRAAYLLCEAITRDKAEKIMYRALTTKLTKQSNFIDFRLAMVKSAEELYGTGTESQAVKTACDQVGILDGSGSKNPDDQPPVPSGDLMLATSTDPSDVATLWIVKPPAQNANDFTSLTQTPVIRKPVVADDGSAAIFIDDDNNLRLIALNPSAPNEFVLDNSGIWNNCALSRDQTLLAANSTLKDASIVLFDMSGATVRSKVFPLETPSYSNTKVPNSIQFADAMDFTFDKQFLLFDCYNEITVGTEKIDFWEINLLNVWDKTKNDFGTGDAQRIFPYEPGVSVGNPVLSRTHPTVFAFDMQNPDKQTGAVMAINIYDGALKKVADVSYPEPGYPTYSGDDRILSFGLLDQGIPTVANIAMNSDGITPGGNPAAFIIQATFPVWFRVGKRPVGIEDQPIPTGEGFLLSQNYPNPFGLDHNGKTHISFHLPSRAYVSLIVHDIMGRELVRLSEGECDRGSHSVEWNGKDASGFDVRPGVYFYSLVTGSSMRTMKMTLVR